MKIASSCLCCGIHHKRPHGLEALDRYVGRGSSTKFLPTGSQEHLSTKSDQHTTIARLSSRQTKMGVKYNHNGFERERIRNRQCLLALDKQ